jgi:endo-1,4-beta-D-glucanase Y/regulation of enolase protein 1 (concanavalin A-like superfamily)
MNPINKVLVFSVASALMLMSALAQNFPFPQHFPYAAGTVKPSSVTQSSMDSTVTSFWSTWKSRYLKPTGTGGRYYVNYNLEGQGTTGAATVSEAHGYGMVLVAYMAGADASAKTYFDGLYNYYKDHPSQNNAFLMAWQQNTSFVNMGGADSATDGDMDIAYSLLLADKQWGSGGTINYLQAATNMINAIMQSDVNQSQWTLRLGDWATSGTSQGFAYATATRPSDFMFDHMRSYYEATGDGRWTNVINKTCTVINTIFNNNSPSTGLIPDFVVLNGSTYQPAPANFLESANDGKYDYNSCRTPWRFATDYLLRGSSASLTEEQKMNSWIQSSSGGNATKVYPGYSLSGTPSNTSYTDSAFTSPFGVCAMINSANQTWVNSIWSWNVSGGITANDGYFGNSIKMQCIIVMSGNWWKPSYASAVPDFSLAATPGSQTVSASAGTSYALNVSSLNGFSGTVNLSVSGLPTGASASFSPASVAGSGSSTLTVSTATTTPSGAYTLTLTGTSGGATHTTTVTLQVTDFSVSASPASQTVVAGNSTTYTLTISAINGFSGNVVLTLSGLPAGATASLNPASITGSGSSTVTVVTSNSTPAGSSTLTLWGSSGSLSHSTAVGLTVTAAGGGLPSGWTDGDIGAVGLAGSATYSGGVFTVKGSGADIYGASDQFNYASQTASGDVTLTARVASLSSANGWSKSGVMIRETTDATSSYVSVYVTKSNGVDMQYRNGTATSAADLARAAGVAAPYWVKLVRSGNTFVGYSSADGVTWTQVGTISVTMASGVTAGLAVCAHDNAALNTSTFDNVSVSAPAPDFSLAGTPASQTVTAGNGTTYTASVGALNGFSGSVALSVSGLPAGASASFSPTSVSGAGSSTLAVTTTTGTPAGTATLTIAGTSGGLSHSATVSLTVNAASPVLTDADIGSPGVAGSASLSGGTYTVRGGGADIYGASDQFNYDSQSHSGDVTLTARVASLSSANGWSKSGVMLRETTGATASYVGIYVTTSNGIDMQYRNGTGTSAVDLARAAGVAAPSWVRLVRSGSTFTGYRSADGVTWTQVGTISVTMASSVKAGLAVCAHDNTALNTSTFDNVSVQ